jgi:hypothetical protein
VTTIEPELSQSKVSGILIGFGNNPCWCIRNTEIEHFSRSHEIIERLHEFRNGSCVIPCFIIIFNEAINSEELTYVNVEDINVVCLKVLQTLLNRELQVLL